MEYCPICGKEYTQGNACEQCGFDSSCDYEHHMTLTSDLPKNVKTISQRVSNLNRCSTVKMTSNVLLCSGCGESHFIFLMDEMKTMCINCGAKLPFANILAARLANVLAEHLDNVNTLPPTEKQSQGATSGSSEVGNIMPSQRNNLSNSSVIDIRKFWGTRLPAIQCRFIFVGLLTQDRATDAIRKMSVFLIDKYAKRVSMSSEEFDDLRHQLMPSNVIGMLLPPSSFGKDFFGLIVTKKAIYINTPGKDGALVVRYKDIEDVKVVKGNAFNNNKLKILLKDGSIRLCSPDVTGYRVVNYISFEKLSQALLELRSG